MSEHNQEPIPDPAEVGTQSHPVVADQTFSDDEAAGERVMQRIRCNEVLIKARALVAKLSDPDYFARQDRIRHAKNARRRAERLIADIEHKRGREEQIRRRERAPRLIFKTRDEAWVALQEKKRAQHREVMQSAAQCLANHPGAPRLLVEKYTQPTDLVYKTHDPEPDISESSTSEAPMDKIVFTGFDSQQAASLSKIIDQLTTIIAEETALKERQLRTEITAKFLELENKMLRSQLEKYGESDVIDFDTAKSAAHRHAR